MDKNKSGFKQQVKNELCDLQDGSGGCMRAELSGLFTPNVTLQLNETGQPEGLILHTDFELVADRIHHLCQKLYDYVPEIAGERRALSRDGMVYRVCLKGKKLPEILKDLRLLKKRDGMDVYEVSAIPPIFLDKQRFLKAYMRGFFLAGGSVTDPEKDYYLELVSTSPALLGDVQETLQAYGIRLHQTIRRKRHVLYAKDGESVATFLQLIGANKALFGVENFRVLKELRNNANRLVNCELSNINKISDAAGKQLAVIKEIQETLGLEMLPEPLRELAELRLNNPEASIRELGEMMTPPLGKSGVFKRFEKMEKLLMGKG